LDAGIFVFSDYFPKTSAARMRFWTQWKAGLKNHGYEVDEVFSTVRTRVFKIEEKWGFLFFQDNNQVLERIRSSGLKIDSFVGICDGCAEGGNYECVHSDPFLGKLLEASSERLDYFTDHSSFLQIPRKPWEFHGRLFFKETARHPSGWNFTLNSLLVRVGQTGTPETSEIDRKLALLSFPEKNRTFLDELTALGEFHQKHPLAHFSPYRQIYDSGILAHYEALKYFAHPKHSSNSIPHPQKQDSSIIIPEGPSSKSAC
jgi:hypothetical protein